MDIIKQLVKELNIEHESYIVNIINLIDDGNTFPFIARYRKEMHGGMDDTTLRALEDRLNYLRNLEKRKSEVINLIDQQGKLTDELSLAITDASTLAEVEDLYRPYKTKRRTRATIAREKGLEPLATLIFEQPPELTDIEAEASSYVNPESGVETVEDALSGASDIIAEAVSDSAEVRKMLRELIMKQGNLDVVASKPDEDSVYSTYYDFHSPCRRVQGHQVLAINRGESEEYLKVSVNIEESVAVPCVARMFVKPGRAAAGF